MKYISFELYSLLLGGSEMGVSDIDNILCAFFGFDL